MTLDKPIEKPSCLDAAYERAAIDAGLVKKPVFPENIRYLQKKLKEQLKHEYRNNRI